MKKTITTLMLIALSIAMILSSCGPAEPPAELTQELVDEAADMVYTLNKPRDNQVAASFTLPARVEYERNWLNVDWELEGGEKYVSLDKSKSDKTTIKVDPYADEDTEFTLKGTIKGGEFVSKPFSFNYIIKQFVLANWQFWKEHPTDETMNIRGIVVGSYPYSDEYKNASLFLQDLDGEHGYFAYRIKVDSQAAFDSDLAVGNVIIVSGKTSAYNGFREMGAGCTYQTVLADDGKSIKTEEVKTISLDDLITEGANVDAALDQYQGMLGEITGAKIKKIEWVRNTPETFEEAKDGRITVTVTKNGVDFPLFLATSCTYTVEQLKEEYPKLDIGYVIDVVGGIASNNGAQLYPIPGRITVKSTEVAAADKVGSELNAVSIPASVTESTTIDLPATGATYSDVAFDWTVSGSENASITDGKLSITVGRTTEKIKVTATATCGDATETRDYEISVVPGNLSEEDIVNALYELSAGDVLAGGPYTLSGKVTEIVTEYSAEHGNITVNMVVGEMTDKPVQCYRLKGEGADALKVGDEITVKGNLKRYKDTFEFDQGCELVSPEEANVAKILDALYALGQNEALEGTYTLSGTIKEVVTPYDSGYGNITVTIVVDGHDDKPVQCFRMIGEGIDTIKTGDKITVSGVLKHYFKNDKSTFEFDAKCTLDSIDFVAEETSEKPETPEQIVKALYALGSGETLSGGPYTLTGKITKVDTPWSDEYKNISVIIVVDELTDYPVLVFRLKGEGAEGLKEGDVITVTGQLKNYDDKGTAKYEFTSGCTLDKIG